MHTKLKRRFCALSVPGALCVLAAAWNGNSACGADIVLIEEQWRLEIGEPDVDLCAPQVSMAFSATGGLEGEFFVFTLNHWGEPEFSPGGLQLQRWCDGGCVSTVQARPNSLLDHDNDVIRWTQRVSLSQGNLKFEIRDGQSQTWNNFGQGDQLAFEHPTSLTRLNTYKPAVSLEESGIGFGGNRVGGLVLERIHWVDADGKEGELVAPIDIDADIDP